MLKIIRCALATLVVLAATAAGAQSYVQQTGTVTPGHAAAWSTSGVLKDAGTATQGLLNSLGLYGSGGTPLCITNSPTPAPFTSTYTQLCLGISSLGAYITDTSYNGATHLPLWFIMNGNTVATATDTGFSGGGGGGSPGGSTYATQYNAGSGAFGGVGPGTSGYVLTSNGASSPPSFQASSASFSATVGGQTVTNGSTTTNQGTGGKLQLSTGSTTTGHCVQFDSNGNTVDAGGACTTGGGGGTVTASPQYQVPYYSSAGTTATVSGIPSGSAGQVFTSAGSSAVPTWTTLNNTVTATCANSAGDGAIIQTAVNTGKTVFIQGPCVLDSSVTLATTSQVVTGSGANQTNLNVPTSAVATFGKGVFIINTGNPGPGPILQDFSINFAQADTSSRSSLTNYPPAIYAQNQTRLSLFRMKITAAMIGIDGRGNSGGWVIDDLKMSAFTVGMWFDGGGDTNRINNWHSWPFGNPNAGGSYGGTLTSNQLTLYQTANTGCAPQTTSGSAGAISLMAGNSYLQFTNHLTITGQGWCTFNTTAASFTATMSSSTTMVVSAVASGIIQVGQTISGGGASGTITAQTSGTFGGTGNYTISASQTSSPTGSVFSTCGGSCAGYGPVVQASNTSFDTYNGIVTTGGELNLTTAYFTLASTTNFAAQQSGGLLNIGNSYFYQPNGSASVPLITFTGGYETGLNPTILNTANLTVTGSTFDVYGGTTSSVISANNSNGSGTITVDSNYFSMNPAATYANPVIKVTGNSTGARIVNNFFANLSSGSGTAISIGTDNWNVVSGNTAPAWLMSFPSSPTQGIYTCNNYGSSTIGCGAGGSGVNPGTTNEVAIYATNGSTVSGTSTPTVTGISVTSNVNDGGTGCSGGACVLLSGNGGGTYLGNTTYNSFANNNFIPNLTYAGTLNLGGSGSYWNVLFANTATLASGATIGSKTVPAISGSVTTGHCVSFASGSLIQDAGATCGSVGNTFTNIYVGGTIYDNSTSCGGAACTLLGGGSGTATYVGNLTNNVVINATSAMYPYLDNTYALGTSAGPHRWTTVYATTGTINTSDARLKGEITDEALGLQFILDQRPVSYVWNDGHNPGTYHGLIAQEVEKTLHGVAFAGLVKPEKDDEFYGLRYDEFIAPLIKAVQQLDERLNIAYGMIFLLVLWNLALTIRLTRRA